MANDFSFKLNSRYRPAGDQPQAIASLTEALGRGVKSQVLLGVTGSGKTFTMANVIANLNRPTLVLAHNKTLAGQLFAEFKELFPENAVEYFVSYYDYYQPEAYLPASDTHIDKEATVNDEIDKLRLSATRSLFERNDVVIVASVSCIYGLGSPEAYQGMLVYIKKGETFPRDLMLRKLLDIQYERHDLDFHRGTFRVRGDQLDIFPAYEDERAIRIEFWGDEVSAIREIDPLRGATKRELTHVAIYPASHFVVDDARRKEALTGIRDELLETIQRFKGENKLLEAQRIEQRTMYDLEMIEQMGYCNGVENYSRHLTGRRPGEAPPTLLDFFPKDWLLFVDESHASIPQVGGMYRGDRARKETLVDFGFRLPSALDNRPLTFDEFHARLAQVVYVSATPADYELGQTQGEFVEQVIRPTGLVDPQIEVRPAATQVDDLIEEIRRRVEKGQRVLVTALTKRMAEELTDYAHELGIKARYVHSDIDTLERLRIIRDLRLGEFDVLIGVNLLREGLDIPEVSLVAILDADKEGFLRSARSLIQTIGRAARHLDGTALLYADQMTDSMRHAIRETDRRREKQVAYNAANGITPVSISKRITRDGIYADGDYVQPPEVLSREEKAEKLSAAERVKEIRRLEKEMLQAAAALHFEQAAQLRDQIKKLKQADLFAEAGRDSSPKVDVMEGENSFRKPKKTTRRKA